MRKKNNFGKKYPLFVPYFNDIEVQKNMIANDDLYRKYDAYNQTIETFIYELSKRFDVDTIRKIIIDTIIKFPDEMMLSIITTYLNSSEITKNNVNFVSFYNKTSNFGKMSIKYVEENGLITSREYKNIPLLALDDKYKSIKNGNELFKNETLDDIYEYLSFKEKEYVISLLENKSFYKLDNLFELFQNLNLKLLLDLLLSKEIDTTILNDETFFNIDNDHLLIMICFLLDSEESRESVKNIKLLISQKRFELLIKLIDNGYIIPLGKINIEEIDMTDSEILEKCKMKGLILNLSED